MDNKKNVIPIRGSDGNIINMEIYTSLPSVSALAREYARNSYPDRYVIFAEMETQPEGSSDKLLYDAESQRGIYMSCILRPSLFPSQASLLGALSAASVVSALEEHTTRKLGIGWVSDIYCNGEIIGNVTIEGKLDNFTTYEYIIVHFALRLDKDNFPPRLTDMIRKVFESENTSISMIIARTILQKFFKFYPGLKTSHKFMDIYLEKFILRGMRVKYGTDIRKRTCRVLGVDSKSGALIIETKEGDVINVTSPTSVTIPKRIKI